MTLFWRMAERGPPYLLVVARAESHAQACRLLLEPEHSPLVHDLTSPGLVARVEAAGAPALWWGMVDRLPSVYDQFRRPGRCELDRVALEDAGFDLT